MTKRGQALNFFIFLLLILTMGCAAMSPGRATISPEVSKAELHERVTTFMQAKVDKEWELAHSFFNSSYKESIPEVLFVNAPRDKELKAYTIESIDLMPSGNEGSVKVTEDISMRGFTFKGLKKTQNWFRESGEWVLIEGVSTPPTPSE